MKKLTTLRFVSSGYRKFDKHPIYIQEGMISEIIPIGAWPAYRCKDSDIGDGFEDDGVNSIVIMNNGNVIRVIESVEQILGIE